MSDVIYHAVCALMPNPETLELSELEAIEHQLRRALDDVMVRIRERMYPAKGGYHVVRE